MFAEFLANFNHQKEENSMKVRTFTAMTEKSLDNNVNHFINNASIEVLEIKFSATIFSVAAMVVYKEK